MFSGSTRGSDGDIDVGGSWWGRDIPIVNDESSDFLYIARRKTSAKPIIPNIIQRQSTAGGSGEKEISWAERMCLPSIVNY